MGKTFFIFCGLVILLPLTSSAQILFKPKEGLWEVTMTHSGGMPGMSDDMLAKLPPEQRARIEEALKQKGMSMNGNTTTVKSCVTKEKIDKGMAFSESRENCTHNVVSSTPNHLEMKMHCGGKDGNKFSMDGTTIIDGINTQTMKGTTHMVTNSDGHSSNMDLTFTSKYLGADCGTIK
jgi:hypothetical protein